MSLNLQVISSGGLQETNSLREMAVPPNINKKHITSFSFHKKSNGMPLMAFGVGEGGNPIAIPVDENLSNVFHRGRFLDSDNPELCGGIKAVYNSAFHLLSLRINTAEVKTGKASNDLKITNLVGGLGQNAIIHYSFADSGTG